MTVPLPRPTHIPVVLAFAVAVAGSGCGPAPGAAGGDTALLAMIDSSLARAAVQYTAMDDALPDGLFPRTTDPDGSLRTNTSEWWTSGFFPGSLWYLHEHTGDPALRDRAEARTRALEREKSNAGDHDIGFKIMSSFGHGWRLTGDSAYLPVIRTAARTLASRFDPRVGAIRSWGEHPDTASPYLVIIDNMMNLELLFWAAEHGGDRSLFDIAVRHADTTLRHHFRPDGSSWHVLEYDPRTGQVLRKRTEQGHADASAWARGQAWGLYGFTMAFRETGYDRYLRQANRIARFILTHPSLPDDGVPYWDFDAPGIPDTHRDASAAAITASAMLELSGFVEDSLRAAYRDYAVTTLRTLSGPEYRAEPGSNADFLLKHGVGHRPADSEVDVPLSYADYYYIEGLMRLRDLITGRSLRARVLPVGVGWARSSVNTAGTKRASATPSSIASRTAISCFSRRQLVDLARGLGRGHEPRRPVRVLPGWGRRLAALHRRGLRAAHHGRQRGGRRADPPGQRAHQADHHGRRYRRPALDRDLLAARRSGRPPVPPRLERWPAPGRDAGGDPAAAGPARPRIDLPSRPGLP